MAHRGTKLFILHSSDSFNFNPEPGLLLDGGLWQCLRVRPPIGCEENGITFRRA